VQLRNSLPSLHVERRRALKFYQRQVSVWLRLARRVTIEKLSSSSKRQDRAHSLVSDIQGLITRHYSFSHHKAYRLAVDYLAGVSSMADEINHLRITEVLLPQRQQ